MTELVVTLLRLSFLVLLWLLVISAVRVLRRDMLATPQRQRGRTERREAIAPAQPATSLRVLAGPLTGARIALGASAVLIGRSPSCTLVIDDDYTSSRHARIFPREGGWWLEDLGSTNGTFVAEVRLGSPQPLDVGVPVRIGTTVLELRE